MLTPADDLLLLYITCPSIEVAEAIARPLVAERLVACANLLSGLVSIYAWKGELQRDAECLLLLKTKREAAAAVAQRVRDLHPYENPCLVTFAADAALPDYLGWLRASVEPPERRSR